MVSIIPNLCKVIILTATKATKAQLLQSLNITDVHKIENSPDKPNFMYVLTYINQDMPLKMSKIVVIEPNKHLKCGMKTSFAAVLRACNPISSSIAV